MYRLDKYSIKLQIDCAPGLYLFSPYSASGKSYLAQLVRKYYGFGEPVNSYTYEDYVGGLSLEAVLGRGPYSLFVVDRYDMYYGAAIDALVRLGECCVVLVDVKQPTPLLHNNLCSVSLKEDEIRVS